MRWGQPLRRAKTVLAAVLAAGMAVSALSHRAPWVESAPDTHATLAPNVDTPVAASDDFDSNDSADEDEISAADGDRSDVVPPSDLH